MRPATERRYWIAVASRDHVARGCEGGFMQVCHGKAAPLRRIQAGDGVIYYSPRTAIARGEPVQAFTAIGVVKDDRIYTHRMAPDFIPHRRDVDFQRCQSAAIQPLIAQLSFIKNKKSWGYVFRFGLLEIPKADFDLIRSAMLGKAKEPAASLRNLYQHETRRQSVLF